jgi:hypothetical protein
MKLDNYKNIKKSEWQVIASQFGISYEENSVVRYLLEKIAEEIGVDSKIVSDNELKKQIVDKINSDFDIIADNEDVEEIPAVDEIPVAELSRLEQLRLECETYGVAWSEIHTEQNLEQVLNGVKSAGVQPIKDMPTTITKSNEITESPSVDINAPFEINSSNATEVAQAVANAPQGNPAFNHLANIQTEKPKNGGYNSSNAYLDTYKNIYLNAIRGHWRVLSLAEINEMIMRDTHTFSHQINVNPQQQNKVEIILSEGNYSVRIPSEDTNDWLDING